MFGAIVNCSMETHAVLPETITTADILLIFKECAPEDYEHICKMVEIRNSPKNYLLEAIRGHFTSGKRESTWFSRYTIKISAILDNADSSDSEKVNEIKKINYRTTE